MPQSPRVAISRLLIASVCPRSHSLDARTHGPQGPARRHRRGRRAYGLTPRSTAILAEGRARLGQRIERSWDGTWTVLGFSLPQSWGSERHTLRSRLQWAGFACLQSGLWVAPLTVDVPALIGDLGLLPHVRVFTARPGEPTEDAQLMEEAFDLDELAGRYRMFLDRWDGGEGNQPADAFAEQLRLSTVVAPCPPRPRLPLSLLPRDWPARRAEAITTGDVCDRCEHRPGQSHATSSRRSSSPLIGALRRPPFAGAGHAPPSAIELRARPQLIRRSQRPLALAQDVLLDLPG